MGGSRGGERRPLPPSLDPRAGRESRWERERGSSRPPRGSRSGRPAPSGRRRLVRGTRIVAGLVSFLVLAGSGYGWAAYHSFVSGVTTIDAIGPHKGPDKDGPAQNILLIGDDHRPANATPQELAELSTQQDGGGTNTDTMMLLHIPSGGGKATVISFPRDSWVDIPGHGKGKLNSAFSDGAAHGGGDAGGISLLIQTIQNLTGLQIDHFVRVSLLGFYQIAKVLGPIQVCLNHAVRDPDSGIDLPAGVSTLDAKQALSFVRQRHGLPRGDLDREVRQQYFLSTELRKVTSSGVLLNPSKLTSLLSAVSSSLQTDPGLDLLQFATEFQDIRAGSVAFTTIPITGTPTIDVGGDRVSIVAVDFLALPAFITTVIGEPSSYTDASPAAPSATTVRVLNGTGTRGLAGQVADQLKARGFTIAGTDNATASTTRTTVTYAPGQEAQAKAVAAAVPGALVTSSTKVAQVTLTLGTDDLKVAGTQPAAGSGSGTAASSSAPPPAPASPAKAFAAGECIN